MYNMAVRKKMTVYPPRRFREGDEMGERNYYYYFYFSFHLSK